MSGLDPHLIRGEMVWGGNLVDSGFRLVIQVDSCVTGFRVDSLTNLLQVDSCSVKDLRLSQMDSCNNSRIKMNLGGKITKMSSNVGWLRHRSCFLL